MEFSPDQCAIRDLTRDFARREIMPHAAAWDRDGAFPQDVLRQVVRVLHAARDIDRELKI